MNSGDAFVLDIGQALFVWNGESCSRVERMKAMDFARRLRDDRGKGNIVVVEEGEETADCMGQDEFEVRNVKASKVLQGPLTSWCHIMS